MIYVTSDLHFCHNRPFLYEPRSFSSIKEHNEAIIQRWNSVVNPEDEVYILGDLMLNDNETGIACLKRLNGTKHFLHGNHDTDTRIALYTEAGLIDEGYIKLLKYNHYRFYLSHYPTVTANGEKGLREMTLNLFGHTHQTSNFYEDKICMYHVGMDSHNCYPVSLDTVIEDMKNKYREGEE